MIVYLNNIPVGKIETSDTDCYFIYNSSYLNQPDSIPISLSLPLDPEPYSEKFSRPFFDGISPQIWSNKDLKEISCAGALSFSKKEYSAPYYKEADLIDCENQLKARGADVKLDGTVRISQVQPQLDVCVIDGQLLQAIDPTHNTHILKADIDGVDDLVGNEIFVSLLAYNLGISVPVISRIYLGDIPALVMDRSDRCAPSRPSQHSTKIHHESFISALSNHFIGTRKNGTINIESQFNLIRQICDVPATDCKTLIRAIGLCLIAGCDDFSLESQLIQIHPNTSGALAPLSGFISSDIYKDGAKNLLDYLFGIQAFSSLKKSHIKELADKISVNDKYFSGVILDLATHLPSISHEIFGLFPAIKSPTTIKIAKLIEQRSIVLKSLLHNRGKAQQKAAG